jgi:hypothetical protein
MAAALTLLRRFVALSLLGLWLGGLTFYTLRVIRAAHQVLGSHLKVGFITRLVTNDLNAIGAAALALLLGNLLLSWRRVGPWQQRALAATWTVAAAGLVWGFLIHARLDAMLDVPARQVREGASFHGPHELYLIATAIQWFAGLAHLAACLVAWWREDSVSPDRT